MQLLKPFSQNTCGCAICSSRTSDSGRLSTRVAYASPPFYRFPYSLIYEEDADEGPQIYAVGHQRREPGYWSSRP